MRARADGPLAGVRVLVGRARHQASAMSAGLEALGARVIEIPFIEIRQPRSYAAFDRALKQIAEYDWLVLTSANGVEALAARLLRLRIPAESLRPLAIAAIGPATRQEIEKLGLKVAVMPPRYVAESVVESMRGRVEGKRVLLARAKVARDLIARELRKMGARVDVVEAYETVVPQSSRKRLRGVMQDAKKRPQVVTFTSSSSVRSFVELLRGPAYPLAHPAETAPAGDSVPRSTLLDGIQMASIGPVTSATLREMGLAISIEAEEYTIPGLIRAIVSQQNATGKSRH
jgi:uroporphyrinogen-III synthase